MGIKYRIVLLRKEFNSIRLVKTLNLRVIDNIVKYSSKSISLNVEQPTYIQNNIIYYFVDIENNAQLFFSEKQNSLNSKELDLVISNKMIKDIMAAEGLNQKEKIINMLIGFAMGAMISLIGALLYITNTQNQLVDNFINGGVIA